MRKVACELLTAPLLTVCDNRYGRGEIVELHAAIGMAAAMLPSVNRAMLLPPDPQALWNARTKTTAMSKLSGRTRMSKEYFLVLTSLKMGAIVTIFSALRTGEARTLRAQNNHMIYRFSRDRSRSCLSPKMSTCAVDVRDARIVIIGW